MPTTAPVSVRRTVNGSVVGLGELAVDVGRACVSGEGTEVYQSSHSRPSDAAATRSSWWSGRSGSRVTRSPVSVTGDSISGRAARGARTSGPRR